MATEQRVTNNTEAAILARVIHPERDDLPSDLARALLRVHFDPEDLERIHELVTKNQDDDLTPAERSELESYLRLSSFLDLMHAKARLSLQRQR